MGEKQKKITVQEAKDILESTDLDAPISDTTRKRAKKIIKLL